MDLSPKIEKPLVLLRAIERAKGLDIGDFIRTKGTDSYLCVVDPNPKTDFFFSIDNVLVHENGAIEYLYSQKPATDTNPDSMSSAMIANNFTREFNYWAGLVTEYGSFIESQQNEEESILEQYEQEEYYDFEIIDEDADTHSYSLPVQRYIDAYLGEAIKRLDTFKEDTNVDSKQAELIDDVIEEAKTLKATQTQLTKQEVVKGLSKLWAKARKAGLDILAEVRKEMFKEGIKTLTEKLLEDPEAVLSTLKGLIE